jgi:sarcosine oxidase subunit gamma
MINTAATMNTAPITPIRLEPIRWTFAWNLRGDASAAAFVSAAERALQLSLPLTACTTTHAAGRSALWLGPRSWLTIGGADDENVDFESARSACNATGGALFDLTAAYAGWLVSGALATTVLNRGCPLDLSAHAFGAGRCAQSLLGHIPALLYRPGNDPRFVVMVERSLAVGALRKLRGYAEPEGYAIAAETSFNFESP